MPSRTVRSLGFFALLVAIAATCGCIREPSPQLIQVLEVTPRDLELGDRLQILGAGFPQGRAAHLSFRGTLRRPGQRPVTGAELDVDGNVTSSQQIELAIDERTEALFCGVATGAEHTTFDGEIEVSFPAATPGAGPITATLYKVTLDLRPPLGPSRALDKRIKEGQRALAYVGIAPALEPPPSGGVVIEKVAPGSRADLAGIVAGDVLVAFDGVRVASPADAIPSPGAQTVTMAVRRGSDPREQYRDVPIDGFRRAPPEQLFVAAMILALAAAAVTLLFGPFGARFAWLPRRVAARMRSELAASGGARAAALSALRHALGSASLAPGARVPPYLVCLALSSALVAFPFAQFRLTAGADVGILFVAAMLSIALLMSAAGVRAALRVVSYQVPAAIAVACVVMMTGSLRLFDIVRAQGGAPWRWYAFKSPIAFALALLFLASTMVTHDGSSPALAEADGPAPAVKRAPLIACVDWAHVFVMSSLAASLFFGGWQIPGVEPAQGAGLELLAGLVLVAKTWALVLFTIMVRWSLPRLASGARARGSWTLLVPAAVAAFAGTVGWVLFEPGRGEQSFISGATLAFAVLLGLAIARAVRQAYADPAANARLNPFL